MQFNKSFHSLVEKKYETFSKLFLELPFDEIGDLGIQLLELNESCQKYLKQNKTPQEIIQEFFEINNYTEEAIQQKSLVRLIQFLERQVALFDALEDAAFSDLHDLKGTGTLANFLQKVHQTNKQVELKKLLANYKTRIVLTAHPTQFYPNTVLGIIRDLTETVSANKSPEQKEILDLLLQMGKTSFSNHNKPTPIDEANSLLWYLENIFYEIFPNIQQDINKATDNNLTNIELGFWPGGDRDGNPFVTHQVTESVSNLLHDKIISLYLQDFDKLLKKLTFPGIYQELLNIQSKLKSQEFSCSEELLDNLVLLRNTLI